MKRYVTIAMFGLALMLNGPATFAGTVDLSLGGTAWYIWWNPAWADAKTTTALTSTSGPALFIENAHDFKPRSNAMAGPVVSISFLERWSLQSVFTIGRFKYKAQGGSQDAQISASDAFIAPSYKKYTRDILKWDSDTSIGCAVHRMVKIFAGFKAQGYRYDEHLQDYLLITSPPILLDRYLVNDVKAYGGGLGIGLTIPLAANLYLMMSASGVVLWSFEKINIKNAKTWLIRPLSGFDILYVRGKKGEFFSYGGTASLSFAYNIEKINTSISLGGRYQLLFNRQDYSWKKFLVNDAAMNIINNQYDHFFGITLSAIYTFHIGKREQS